MSNEDYRKELELIREKYKKEFDFIMKQKNATPIENEDLNKEDLMFISDEEDDLMFISDDEEDNFENLNLLNDIDKMDIFQEDDEFDLENLEFLSEDDEFDFENSNFLSDDDFDFENLNSLSDDFDFENLDSLSDDDDFDLEDVELLTNEELDLDYYALLDEDEKREYDNLFIDHHKLISEKKALQKEREAIVNELMAKYADSGIRIFTNKEKSLITIGSHSFDPTNTYAIEQQIEKLLKKREEARVRTEKAINDLKNSIARRNYSKKVVTYRHAGGEYTEYILENDDRIVMHLKDIKRAMSAVRNGGSKVIVISKKNKHYKVIDVTDHQISSFQLIP